ncbi:MAG: leucine-rich repeat domain-containing protein [Bacteroidaceae bacterium]|nr:leucine-rich repeat domain-containing protein [Bacteroidaceae bacterium]
MRRIASAESPCVVSRLHVIKEYSPINIGSMITNNQFCVKKASTSSHAGMRRIFLVCGFLLMSLTGMAYDVKIGGIYYNLSGSEATVTYLNNQDNSTAYSGSVVIPSTISYQNAAYRVTAIGENAFSDCTGLTQVSIPDGMKSISSGAFYNCTGLTSITIPESITHMGSPA